MDNIDGWQFHSSGPGVDIGSISQVEDWQPMTPAEITADLVDGTGVFDGWFRIRFRIAEELSVEQWWFRYMSWAPVDVYLDGEKVLSFGDVNHNEGHVDPYRLSLTRRL